MARKVSVEILGDASSLHRAFRRANSDAGTFGNNMHRVGRIGHAAFRGIAIAGGVGLGAAAVGLKKSVTAAEEHEKAMAQTRAAIKSTGGAAKVSADHINTLAQSIQNYSGVNRDAIQTSENILLAFTKVRNEGGKGNAIFDRATKVIQDYAVRTGKSPTTAAVLFGKALEDPAHKVAGLARSGVVFSDSLKKQIASMAEHGNILGAQNLILAELERRYGGAGKAAGETFGGKLAILKLRLRDIEIAVGEKLIPVLERFMNWADAHWPQISAGFTKAWEKAKAAWETKGKPIFDAVVRDGKQVVTWIRANWPEISDTISAAFRTAAAAIRPFLALVRSAGRVVRGMVEVVSGLLHGDFRKAWRGVKNIVAGAFAGLAAQFRTIVHRWATIFGGIGHLVGQALVAAFNGIKGIFERFRDWMEKMGIKLALALVEPFSHLPKGLGKWARDLKKGLQQDLYDLDDKASRRAAGVRSAHLAKAAASGATVLHKSGIIIKPSGPKGGRGDIYSPNVHTHTHTYKIEGNPGESTEHKIRRAHWRLRTQLA
jgi:hypothetical protein